MPEMPGIDELESCLVVAFSKLDLHVNAQDRTQRIMSAICEIGLARHYEVCCRNAPNATFGEWLYDMGWYDNEGDFMIDAPLALECEWTGFDLDSDFKKVLVARASHRVYIFKQPDETRAVNAIDMMIEQVKKFRHSVSGDRYLFFPVVKDRMLKPRLYVHLLGNWAISPNEVNPSA